ncbi:MAG: L,D-transpeptidase family protein, partial [Desulfobacterales bacterium]
MKHGYPIRHLVRLFLLLLMPMLLTTAAAASGLPPIGQFLSAVLVAIEGGSESPVQYAVLVEKKSQTLFLFSVEQGKYREVFREPCSTGEIPGAKEQSGDKKTPEGVYFFIKEHPERDLAPIYGSRAFPIDYPNLMDRLSGRGGNAIWLHGTNKPLEPRDSNGCIVVTNEVIDRLAGYITLNRTPMIIVDRIPQQTDSDSAQQRQAVTDLLTRWQKALSLGTYHEYLSAYDPSFLPDLSWWPDWDRLRKKLQQERISFSVSIEKPAIFRLKDQYTVLVDQVVRTPFQEVFLGTRKLFIARGPSGLRIVGDEAQVLADNRKET